MRKVLLTLLFALLWSPCALAGSPKSPSVFGGSPTSPSAPDISFDDMDIEGVLPTDKGGTGSSTGDISALIATPTGSATSDSVADWLGAFPTSNLSVASDRIVTGITDTILSTDGGKTIPYRSLASVAVTIPSAASAGFTQGFSFNPQAEGVGGVVLTPNAGFIQNIPSLSLNQGESCWLRSDGTNWYSNGCAALSHNPVFGTGLLYTADSRLTFANTSAIACSYYDATGAIAYSASSACAGRISYVPDTHVLRGALVEKTSTNYMRKSNNIINQATYWSNVTGTPTFDADAAIAPDGTATFALFTRTNTTTTYFGGDSATVTAEDVPVVCSVYSKKGAGGNGYVAIRVYASSYTNRIDATGNLNNCTISGARDYGTSDTYGFTAAENIGNGVCRFQVGATHIDPTGTGMKLYFSPVAGSTDNVDVASGQTNGDSVYLWGAQCERGVTAASSYIATNTAAVTRNNDDVSITNPYWLKSTQGTACIDFTVRENTSGAYVMSDTAQDRALLYFYSATNAGTKDGTNTNDHAIAFSAAGTANKACVTYSGSSVTVTLNGVAGTPGTFDGDFNLAGLKFFADHAGNNRLGGTIKNYYFWSYARSAAEDVAWTTP